MGMTIAEKILAKKSGRDRVAAGDLVTVKVDTVVLFDNNFMPSIWQDVLKMEHPERVVVIIDHRAPAPTIQPRRSTIRRSPAASKATVTPWRNTAKPAS